MDRKLDKGFKGELLPSIDDKRQVETTDDYELVPDSQEPDSQEYERPVFKPVNKVKASKAKTKEELKALEFIKAIK